jgi:PPE-repeat protein
MLDFGALPPEINSSRMYAGPGSGSLAAAAVAWDELASELQFAASAYQSVITGLTSGPWLGPAATAAATAATPYAAWMNATAGQAEEAAAQAKAAIGAYETAFMMTVPPPVVAANRALLAALTATNFFGQNSAAIAATEALYSEMWAQDAAAMYGYAGSSAAASTLTAFTSAPQVTDPTGTAAQGSAVAQATGEAAGSTQTTLAQLLSSVPTTLEGLASPASNSSGLSGMLSELTSGLSSTSLPSVFSDIGSSDWISIAPSWLMTSMTPLYGLSAVLGMAQTMQGMATTAAQGVAGAAEVAAADAAGAAAGAAGAAGWAGDLGALASMGQAASLGSLSVPPAWTSVIPTAHLTSAGVALQNGGMGELSHVPPSMLGGLPARAANGAGAPGPRYGQIPTVMAQPPSAGYGSAVI